MIVGFTGTREGWTQAQVLAMTYLLMNLKITEAHHGDCVGSDAQFHTDIRRFHPKAKIGFHPPEDPRFQAKCHWQEGDIEYPPLPYLQRNQEIVNKSLVLIATPKGYDEEQRSGTWATVRYARKLYRRIYIVWPDGKITTEREGPGKATIGELVLFESEYA